MNKSDSAVSTDKRKLLGFTDNRQDASLQAGHFNDFVQVLRRHRLRVSPAESLDALRGLEQVGLGERAVVRDTLRATLIKDQEDVEAFDRLFDVLPLQDAA